MADHSPHQIAQFAGELQSGNEAARAALMSLLYEELRTLASNFFRSERSDHTLQPTAPVHEAFIRIVELRFYGGLSVEQVAHVLDVSPRTVELDWRMSRAWLRKRFDEAGRP